MWLIALYVPAMAPVNSVFIPPQWYVFCPHYPAPSRTDRPRIALSVFVIEIFTVFVPCWQVRKHQNLRQETLDCIASWESKKKKFGSADSTSDNTSTATTTAPPPFSPTSIKFSEDVWKKLPSFDGSSDIEKLPDDGVMTMAALEHVLDKNPEPLRQFSARRDFSGENIAFLTAVAEWKAALPAPFLRNRHNTSPEVVRQQFCAALRIYTEFISPRDAEFPINIAWHELRKLQGIFERAARTVYDGSNPPNKRHSSATPFDEVDWQPEQSQAAPDSRGSEAPIAMPERKNSALSTDTLVLTQSSPGAGATDIFYQGDIPQVFDAAAFDAAQASIKYLVLTNTWPKYVKERRSSEQASTVSGTTGRSTVETSNSKSSLKRALAFLKPMVR